MLVRPFAPADEAAVVALWQACGQMREVERRLEARGCPKINLLVRTTNTQVLDFYRSLGYAPDDALPLGRRLIPDV